MCSLYNLWYPLDDEMKGKKRMWFMPTRSPWTPDFYARESQNISTYALIHSKLWSTSKFRMLRQWERKGTVLYMLLHLTLSDLTDLLLHQLRQLLSQFFLQLFIPLTFCQIETIVIQPWNCKVLTQAFKSQTGEHKSEGLNAAALSCIAFVSTLHWLWSL